MRFRRRLCSVQSVRRFRFGDVRAYVHALETWTIETLGELGVEARTIEGRVGVWVRHEVAGRAQHDKIAAIGPTLYAQPIPPLMLLAAMKLPTVTYHAPQIKNSRNIMIDRLVIKPAEPRTGGVW